MTRLTPRNKTVTLKLMSRPRTHLVALRYGAHLDPVNGCQSLDGLELDDQSTGHQEVEAAFANAVALVRDCNRNLALERYVAQPELNAQCVFVDRFEKPRSECLVHLDRRSDDLRCYAIKLSVRFPSSRWRPGVLALHTSAFGHVAAKLPPN